MKSIRYDSVITVVGKNFLTEVTINNGKALEELDIDGHYFSGVSPVGFMGEGFDKFVNMLHSVLCDLAHESETFEDFNSKASEFLASSTDIMLNLWNQNPIQCPDTTFKIEKLLLEPRNYGTFSYGLPL